MCVFLFKWTSDHRQQQTPPSARRKETNYRGRTRRRKILKFINKQRENRITADDKMQYPPTQQQRRRRRRRHINIGSEGFLIGLVFSIFLLHLTNGKSFASNAYSLSPRLLRQYICLTIYNIFFHILSLSHSLYLPLPPPPCPPLALHSHPLFISRMRLFLSFFVLFSVSIHNFSIVNTSILARNRWKT